MPHTQFAFWFGQMLLGFAFFVGGLELVRLFWAAWWQIAAAGAAASAVGIGLMVQAELRERPQRVLRKARRTLNLPTQWAVKFDKVVPQGGVIPVAVIRSDGVRFVIDIQAYADAEWSDPMLDDGDDLLVGAHGKKFKTDPVAPLMLAAEAWGATPVLWLPDARQMRNLRRKSCNLIVVLGSARELKHALRGAEIVPQRRDDETTRDMMRPRSAPRRSGMAPLGSPELV